MNADAATPARTHAQADFEWVHATCVAVRGQGVLLLGASGSGKSDLALRMMHNGAVLVGDDQLMVSAQGGGLMAQAPMALAGLLEVRGIGVLQVAHMAQARVALAVMLVKREDVERMPEPQFFRCGGGQVPLISLHAFDLSTEAKIHMMLAGAE